MQTYLVDSFKYCTYFFFKHFKLFTLITIEKKKFFRVYKTVQDINIDVSCNIIYNMQFLKKKIILLNWILKKKTLMIISAIDNKFTITFSYSKYLRIISIILYVVYDIESPILMYCTCTLLYRGMSECLYFPLTLFIVWCLLLVY